MPMGLDGYSTDAWNRAEKNQVSANIDSSIDLLKAHRPQSDSTDDLAKELTYARGLYETWHHLVTGPHDSRSKPGTIVWRKHARRGGNHWSHVELDAAAINVFANDIVWCHQRIIRLQDEVLPQVITTKVTYPDGRKVEET